jgi:hypothetical protein
VGVVVPEHRLHQIEGRLVHPGRVGIPAGGVVGRGEVIAADERLGVVGPQLRLPQLEGRLVQLDGLGGAAGGVVGRGEVIAAGEGVGVVGAQLRLAQLKRGLVQRDGLGSAAGFPVGDGEVVAGAGRSTSFSPQVMLAAAGPAPARPPSAPSWRRQASGLPIDQPGLLASLRTKERPPLTTRKPA